jgi:carbon storage regulator
MLILTRRVGEVVMVGDAIKVVVVGAAGGQVRLGIDAPREVAVHREEIYEKVKREEQRPPAAPEEAPAQGREGIAAQSLLEKIQALGPQQRAEVVSHIDILLKERER